jgi:predicted phage-related endonuclease
LQEDWAGHRVVELQGERVTPNAIASAFAKALGRSVRAEALPRERWEEAAATLAISLPRKRSQHLANRWSAARSIHAALLQRRFTRGEWP